MAKIADRNPGFAGFYMRGSTLVLRVRDAQIAAVTAEALRQALSADPDVGRFHGWLRALADAPVELETSRYDARELWEFRMRALRQLFGGAVHRLDLDESTGVIRLGVADAGDVAPIAGRVSAAGIPADAVVIEVEEPVQPQATLRDRLRPVPGGIQIVVENGGGCTLTANGWMIGPEAWGFLTCAHCTSAFGSAGGEAAYQNEDGYGNVIGWELLDPPLWQPGQGECPDVDSVLGCRYTDAAFFAYESSSYPDSMTIARTTGFGSYTIDANHPRFAVSGPSPRYPTQGMDVHKIGRTTGWTTGEVTGTCVDAYAYSDSLIRFCSYITDYSSDGGDSGAPVFTWDGSSFMVELIGIHWGGSGIAAAFSPYFLIMIEIDGEFGGVVYAY